MTESEWLACTDASKMLEYLGTRFSDRKLRLFLCACCRGIWDLLPDGRSRQAVEVAERFADDLARPLELAAAGAAAIGVERGLRNGVAMAAYWVTKVRPREIVENVVNLAVGALSRLAVQAARTAGTGQARAWNSAWAAGADDQVRLLRDLAGNPFHSARVDPGWLMWNHGTVRRMAQVIYDERRFDDLPLLADALEEAGCDDDAILAHCRGGESHVLGCWVVDCLLEKE